MALTKEFLVAEIRDLEQEIQKANAFVLKAQGAIEAYRVIINKLDAPEPDSAGEENGGCGNLTNNS